MVSFLTRQVTIDQTGNFDQTGKIDQTGDYPEEPTDSNSLGLTGAELSALKVEK